ncbi:hypothetical protein E2C01_087320 [Portunus trituberculatus]|uniref:Uncharacterized protein n=1 Tax=Portunus trituberculatus TaxID=210409 RepID=A0A5B7J304_PORTR|nr:hypothetical protein [Portunus trituberculatus]
MQGGTARHPRWGAAPLTGVPAAGYVRVKERPLQYSPSRDWSQGLAGSRRSRASGELACSRSSSRRSSSSSGH